MTVCSFFLINALSGRALYWNGTGVGASIDFELNVDTPNLPDYLWTIPEVTGWD